MRVTWHRFNISAGLAIANLNANHYHSIMDHNGNTLASLQRGQKGIIESVDASDPLIQRLMVLGLVEGAEIELAGTALGGDPMEFRLFGCGISLRQEQARQFTVTPCESGD